MASRKERSGVTNAELAVLEALWQLGPSPIRRLADRLYPDGGPSHYSTVQKLLERLESKAYVRRRARGRINVYNARVDRKDLIARRLRETADRLCDGSLAPLLTHLVGSVQLTAEEIDALRELVDRPGGPPSRKGSS